MANDIDNAIIPVLKSGYITQGNKVEEFESKLKEYFNHPYILTLNSATAGLTLALKLYNTPNEGGEVLASPLTCFATTSSILANGLRIKWIDTDPMTGNIDLDDLERKITNTTRILIFVHWAGTPIDWDRLAEIQRNTFLKYNFHLKIVEDCAHAFGAKFNNKFLGTNVSNADNEIKNTNLYESIAVYSLQAIKHLTTGDGGLIFLPNQELYERAKLLRWYGISREKKSDNKSNNIDFRLEGDISESGFKFHMNDINATIGITNLPYMTSNLGKVRENAGYYQNSLSGILGVQLLNVPERATSSFWIYSLKVADKPSFIRYMTERKIMVSQVHKANDGNSCVSEYQTSLPQTRMLEKNFISIPVGWWVTSSDRERIVNYIMEWSKERWGDFRLLTPTPDDYKQFLELYGNDPDNITGGKSLSESEYNFLVDCDDNRNFWGIFRDGILKAVVRSEMDYRHGDCVCRIEDVYVSHTERGKEYGTALIWKVIDVFKKGSGFYKIVLNCKDRLVNFYHNSGLKVSGVMMEYRLK